MATKLEIIDDEVMYVDRYEDGIITSPLEVSRPTERQARKLLKQLQELLNKK